MLKKFTKNLANLVANEVYKKLTSEADNDKYIKDHGMTDGMYRRESVSEDTVVKEVAPKPPVSTVPSLYFVEDVMDELDCNRDGVSHITNHLVKLGLIDFWTFSNGKPGANRMVFTSEDLAMLSSAPKELRYKGFNTDNVSLNSKGFKQKLQAARRSHNVFKTQPDKFSPKTHNKKKTIAAEKVVKEPVENRPDTGKLKAVA